VRFPFKRLLRHIYVFLFESPRRGIRVTPNRLLILAVFLFVLVPLFLPAALLGWLLDTVLFPRHREVTIRQPVFIIGNMRSGTTFLHRLMAEDTCNFCYLQTWELGFAPTITQRKLYETIARIDAALGGLLARLIRLIDTRLLSQNKLHPSGLFEAEEDDLLLLYVWSSTFSMGVFPFPDEILNYVLPFDDLPEERARVMPFYKGALQRHLYHHGAGEKHILSKNPVFSSRVDALYETFPDARFIYLIRNPLNVVASMGSYGRVIWDGFQGAVREFPYDSFIWETVKKWYTYTLDRLAQAPPESSIIVNFDEMTHNPREVITRIYAHFGLELTPEFDQMLIQATASARAYASNHTYSFENTTFTREQVMEELGDLIRQYGFDEEKEFAGNGEAIKPPPHAAEQATP
jgi:hypothetical protein